MSLNSHAMDELLNRTAVEIGRCRSMVVRLEDTVQNLVGSNGTGTRGAGLATTLIRDLQILDLLDQHLQDLCLWTEALAKASRGCTISSDLDNLTRPLRLEDLRRGLGGNHLPQASHAERTEVF